MMKGANYYKVFSVNFIIFILILFLPGIFLKFIKKFNILDQDPRALLPISSDKNKQIKIFKELNNVTQEYFPYVGWLPYKFKSKYTNIDEIYRYRESINTSFDSSTFFFGGSTMWGFGVADNETIPSHYAKINNSNVINFGVGGWVSRQSLNRLMDLYSKEKFPKKVIFLDGHNEIEVNCKKITKSIPDHSRSKVIHDHLLRTGVTKSTKYILTTLLEPYINIAKSMKSKSIKDLSAYDCYQNPSKSKIIAKQLINNWKAAYLISKSNNVDFTAILQPVVFDSENFPKYFDQEKDFFLKYLKKEYEYVYPFIINEMNNACIEDKNYCKVLIDGRKWLAFEKDIWIDWSHVTSDGNKILAETILKSSNQNIE